RSAAVSRLLRESRQRGSRASSPVAGGARHAAARIRLCRRASLLQEAHQAALRTRALPRAQKHPGGTTARLPHSGLRASGAERVTETEPEGLAQLCPEEPGRARSGPRLVSDAARRRLRAVG